VKSLAQDSGDTGVRATVYDAINSERITMTGREPIAGPRLSFWFVMLSPILGILAALLALILFAD
jgi:hypothetical protein